MTKRNNKGETAEQRAARKWRNKDLTERFKKGDGEFSIFDGKKYFATEGPKPPKDPNIGKSVITEDGRTRNGAVRQFERRFIKDLRAMMEGTAQRNLSIHLAGIKASLERRRVILLAEKLRRLKLMSAAAETERDLFGYPTEVREMSK